MLGGCTYRVTRFGVLSPHATLATAQHSAARQVTGEDCAWVLFVPLGLPNLQDAINDALAKAGPQYDALANGTVYFDNQALWVGRRCFRVVGTPIDTRSIGTSRG